MSKSPAVRRVPTTAPQTRVEPPSTRPTMAARVISIPISVGRMKWFITANSAPIRPIPADPRANIISLVRKVGFPRLRARGSFWPVAMSSRP